MNGARGWPLLFGQGPRASKAVIMAHTRLAHLQGYLAHKKTHPLGPYRKPMPRGLEGS